MAIITLDEMKAHLGIIDDSDDALITDFIGIAQAHFEKLVGFVIETEFPPEGSPAVSTVPADIVGAVRMLAAHYFENREASLVGLSVVEPPFGVWDVVREHRPYTWGATNGA